MRAVPFPALSLGGTTCEALMSALNFICSAREGEEIIADGIAIPRTAEMEASLLMKGPSEICFLPPRVGTIVPVHPCMSRKRPPWLRFRAEAVLKIGSASCRERVCEYG